MAFRKLGVSHCSLEWTLVNGVCATYDVYKSAGAALSTSLSHADWERI